jgi:hypothetical protein
VCKCVGRKRKSILVVCVIVIVVFLVFEFERKCLRVHVIKPLNVLCMEIISNAHKK